MEFQCKKVCDKFDSYPSQVREKMLELRQILFDVAKEKGIDSFVETLKWGEPAYLCRTGSTIRIDWKSKTPDRLFIYLNCKTTLVETFKEVFPCEFEYYGNRALGLPLDLVRFPLELESCFVMAMRYHQIKDKPLLGYGR